MKNKKLIILPVLLLLFLSIFTGCPTIITDTTNPYDNKNSLFFESFAPDESWTFMIYLDGDNNLEDAAVEDFNEMVSGLNNLNNSNIRVIVLIDRIDGYDNNYLGESSDWTGARLYQINQTNSYTKLTDGWFPDGDEINMGAPKTLENFIYYCKTNFSSNHYALILWNHGGGARSKSTLSSSLDLVEKAVCWDDSNDDDCLYLDEVQQAVSQYFNSSNKLDFIGFDACLMGTVEVAYEFRNLALVMVGSMANEWGDGWDYDALFKGMASGTNNDPKELGKLVVKTYRDSTISEIDQTLSAIDLTQIATLKTCLDNLSIQIYRENQKSNIEELRDNSYHFYESDDDSIAYPYFDLNDLAIQLYLNSQIFSPNLISAARNTLEALSNAIIVAYAGSYYGNYYGPGSQVKRGLSIFFSRGNLTYTSQDGTFTHYAYQWWYTSLDTNTNYSTGYFYGKIDFADSDSDGIVETWRELLEAWYDNSTTYTPGSY